MKKILRFFKHLFAARWQVTRRLSKHSMNVIETAIRESEIQHMGEIRFAVEAGLDWPELLSGVTSRQRAITVFSQLQVWDTEHNSGVLIYLLLADRTVEIVADRGIHSKVGTASWTSICQDMENKFRASQFEEGVLLGINAITALLKLHYPAHGHKLNELPDRPTIL